jgi:yecA family protein
MSTLPEISILDEVLFKMDAWMGAAESHGALCGMLCARGATELSEWMGHVLGEQAQGSVHMRDSTQQLTELHQTTLEQLNDVSGEFYLLLPDDDDALDERTDALANWCQGFVYGLAAGGIDKDRELPEDSLELLLDFIEISRAGHGLEYDDSESQSTEADEMAYVEIMEYVRTGVLLINEELQPVRSTQTVH